MTAAVPDPRRRLREWATLPWATFPTVGRAHTPYKNPAELKADVLVALDENEQQQRVVEAAQRYVGLAKRIDEYGVSADTAMHDAWFALCESVAAVSLTEPEKP